MSAVEGASLCVAHDLSISTAAFSTLSPASTLAENSMLSMRTLSAPGSDCARRSTASSSSVFPARWAAAICAS